MINPEFITQLFTAAGFVQLIKYLIIFAEIVYLLYALIIIREVSLMNRSFKTSAAPLFTITAFGHFFATVLTIIISLSVL